MAGTLDPAGRSTRPRKAEVGAREPVQQRHLEQRVDHRRDAHDFRGAVREPAGHRDAAVADPAEFARFLEGAVEWRVGQRVQRFAEGGGDGFICERAPGRGGMRGPVAQQEVELPAHHGGGVRRRRTVPGLRGDGDCRA
jgi:hypothetical protein